MERIKVCVIALHHSDGSITPKEIEWTDGLKYPVTYVFDTQKLPSKNPDYRNYKFVCRIDGKRSYLFFEDGIWSVGLTPQ